MENADIDGGYAAAPAMTLDKIEQVLASNLLTEHLMHPHPDFEHTYLVEADGQKHPMSFDREVYDRNPDMGFVTYQHPVFESLLDDCLGGTSV